MNIENINKFKNNSISVDVHSVQDRYATSVGESLSAAKTHQVAVASLSNNPSKFFIVDTHLRTERGRQNMSLAPSAPEEYTDWRGWYKYREDYNNPPVYKRVFQVPPPDFFGACTDNWKEDINKLFYQGFGKDDRLVSAFKCCMIPLPFDLHWQPYNNHMFLFTQTKTGKTAFAEDVLGCKVVLEPTAPGLLGGVLNNKMHEGKLEGTGTIMLDEINSKESGIFDVLLNVMEKGTANRAIVSGASCASTKTLVFCGNPESDTEALLALDFRAILNSMVRPGSNIDRISGRLGLFCYGIDYKKATETEEVSQDEVAILRNVAYDTLSLLQWEYKDFLSEMRPWLRLKDEEWVETIKKLSLKVTDAKIYQFVRGWLHSVDNMRMAALRWTLLEHLDEFMLQKGGKNLLKPDSNFMVNLEEHYSYVKKDINLDSLERLKGIRLKGTYEEFKVLAESYPAIMERSTREIQVMFGLGSQTTASKWKEMVDNERARDVEILKPATIRFEV